MIAPPNPPSQRFYIHIVIFSYLDELYISMGTDIQRQHFNHRDFITKFSLVLIFDWNLKNGSYFRKKSVLYTKHDQDLYLRVLSSEIN